MASGELSPWAPGASSPAADPYVGSYHGPWGPVPDSPPPVTDELLRRLPPPVAGPSGVTTTSVGDQRPALVGLAVTLAVTASLLWACGLSLFAVVALVGSQEMEAADDTGVVFHTLDQFVLRMGDGLWVPLYGFPVVSVVTGFLLLSRRPWARVAHTAVGLGSLAWAGWWLRGSLLAWVAVAVYVGTSVAVLWAPSVGRWYASRSRRRPAGHRLNG
ncbi:MAG: hypothetical protein ACRYG2_11895 [Janthinobacterium lividum]